MTKELKESLKQELIASLCSEKEIDKIILFGSFINSDEPGDMDVAIFQTSNESYLNLAMKYRKLTRSLAKKITLDLIPIKPDAGDTTFLSDIESGEVVFER